MKVNKRLNKLELSPIKNDLASFRKSIMDEISSIKSDITVISGQMSAEFVSAETAEDLLNPERGNRDAFLPVIHEVDKGEYIEYRIEFPIEDTLQNTV